MYNYRFFAYTMLVGVFFQPVCAMELVDSNDEQNGVVIQSVAVDMHHFWSDDYRKNIAEIKSIDLQGIRSNLKKDNYLSPHAKTLDHLMYLSTICQMNKAKTLFTEKQQNKFDTAETIKKCVPWGFGANVVVIAGTALFSFTNFAALAQCSNATTYECLSQISAIMTPTLASVGGALAVGGTSWLATGYLPDLASRKADEMQDEIGHLSHKYATVAKYLIDIHFEAPEKARYIVDKFDIDELKLRAQKKTYNAKAGKDLVSPLEEAWHFIKNGSLQVPITDIEMYTYIKILIIENKKMNGRLETLYKRLDALEQRVQEQDEKIKKQDAEIEKLKQE